MTGYVPKHLPQDENLRGSLSSLRGRLFNFWGGGGGVGDFEKNILQVHMHKKKILAQDHRAKKISCTYSGLEKKFWQDVPWANTLNFINQQTVKRF